MNEGVGCLKSLNWNMLQQNDSGDDYDSDETFCDINDIVEKPLALSSSYKNQNCNDKNGGETNQILLVNHNGKQMSLEYFCHENMSNKNIMSHNCNSLKQEVNFDNNESVNSKNVQILSPENNEHQRNVVHKTDESDMRFVNCSFTDNIVNDSLGFGYDVERIEKKCETLHSKVENYMILSNENKEYKNSKTINYAHETDKNVMKYPAIDTHCTTTQSDDGFLEGLSQNLDILMKESDSLINLLKNEERLKTRSCSPPLTLRCEVRRKRLPAQKVLPKYSKKHANSAITKKVLPPRKCASLYNKRNNQCGEGILLQEECDDTVKTKMENTTAGKLQSTLYSGKKQSSKEKNTDKILVKPSVKKQKKGKRGRKKKICATPENLCEEKENLGELLMEIETGLVDMEKRVAHWVSGADPQPPTREEAFLMLKNTQSAAAKLEILLQKNNRNVYKTRHTLNKVKKARKIMKILLNKSNQIAITIDKTITECDRIMDKELHKMFQEEGCGSSQEDSQDSSEYSSGSNNSSCSAVETRQLYSNQIHTTPQKKPKSILKCSSSENSTENTSETKHISFSDEVDFRYLSGSNVSSLGADGPSSNLHGGNCLEEKAEHEANEVCLSQKPPQTKIDFLQEKPLCYGKEQSKLHTVAEETPLSTNNTYKRTILNNVNEPCHTTIEKGNINEITCSENITTDLSLVEENCSLSFNFNLFQEQNLSDVTYTDTCANAETTCSNQYPQNFIQNLLVPEINNEKMDQSEIINYTEDELEDLFKPVPGREEHVKNNSGKILLEKRKFDCFNSTNNQFDAETSVLARNSNQPGYTNENYTFSTTNNEIAENIGIQNKTENFLCGKLQRQVVQKNTVIEKQNILNADNTDTVLSETSTENCISFGFSEVVTQEDHPNWTKITVMSIKGIRIKDSSEYNFEANSDGSDEFGDLANW